jgi:hypothetical protein
MHSVLVGAALPSEGEGEGSGLGDGLGSGDGEGEGDGLGDGLGEGNGDGEAPGFPPFPPPFWCKRRSMGCGRAVLEPSRTEHKRAPKITVRIISAISDARRARQSANCPLRHQILTKAH